MVSRDFNGNVVSGVFRKIKLPFLPVNEFSLVRILYSRGVHLKIYRKTEPEHTYEGSKRDVFKLIEIDWRGLNRRTFYNHNHFNIEVDDFSRIKVDGFDLV